MVADKKPYAIYVNTCFTNICWNISKDNKKMDASPSWNRWLLCILKFRIVNVYSSKTYASTSVNLTFAYNI